MEIKFERDALNIFYVRALTSSGSTGGRGAKTIISPNTSFGDIIIYVYFICLISFYDFISFYICMLNLKKYLWS